MPSLRAQVEQVIRKHSWQISTNQGFDKYLRDMLDDLCHLLERREPSRKELNNLLQRWIPKGLTAHGGPFPIVKEEFLDALMAWQRGEAEPRRWCAEITWQQAGGFPDPHWWYRTDTQNTISDDWKFCPSCAAPKPEG